MEATQTERNTGSQEEFPFCNTALSYSIRNGQPKSGTSENRVHSFNKRSAERPFSILWQQPLYKVTDSYSTIHQYMSCFYFPSTANVLPSRDTSTRCALLCTGPAEARVQQAPPHCTQQGQNPHAAGHSSIQRWVRADG